MSWSQALIWAINQLKFGSSYHLWYVYMIIGIYMFIPVLGKWIRNTTSNEILYFLVIWLITLCINSNTPIQGLDFYLAPFTGFVGYLVLGYYLSFTEIANHKVVKKLIVPLIIAGVSTTVIGTYYLTQSKQQFAENLYGYFSPNVLLASIGIFLLVKQLTITSVNLIKLINIVSKYSFGIYLVHILVLTCLEAIGIYWKVIHPLIGIPITTILSLFLSVLIIYAVNKLPFGKRISG